MTRIKLTVAYDGTDFCGWAAQTGQRTVQGTLRDAVRRISGEDCEIVGASRTDSGAHARGQVCHFDSRIPADRWVNALNQSMERDIRAVKAEAVSEDFNARFMAMDRTYWYKILRNTTDPFRQRYAHAIHWDLDVNLMKQAAAMLVGRHDFRAFTEELDPSIQNTVRRLYGVEVIAKRDEVCIAIRGTAFLRGMMRRMSGALLEVGRGKRSLESFSRLLTKDRDQESWPVVLPANGLTLMKVRYGRHPRDCRVNPRKDVHGEDE